MNAAQASRSQRALAEYDRYSFRCLDRPGEYPVEVTSPKGSRYVVTVDHCTCEGKKHAPHLIDKHQEMVLLYLEKQREWLNQPERCPCCNGLLVLNTAYTGANGYLTRYSCSSCRYQRTV